MNLIKIQCPKGLLKQCNKYFHCLMDFKNNLKWFEDDIFIYGRLFIEILHNILMQHCVWFLKKNQLVKYICKNIIFQ